MPVPHKRVLEIARKLTKEHTRKALENNLSSTTSGERPVPPTVPGLRDPGAAGTAARVRFIEEHAGPIPHLAGRCAPPDPSTLQGNIENFIGMTQIPTGLVGPLRINGIHANGDFYIPLATTEGALVASYARGARLATLSGGVASITTVEQVQRAPGFKFQTMSDAIKFAAWAVGEFDRLREVAGQATRHGRLLDMRIQFQANLVYIIFDFQTGDAAGQNMVTKCTAAVCEELMTRTPVTPEYWVIESNMSGDKKATALSFFETRGRHATAELVVPRALVLDRLRTTPERMADYWRMGFIGGVQTGSIGVSGHIANAVAALFMACGQDVACVSEASVAIPRLELTENGDLYASLTLPSLLIGTVGGGTRLPTSSECLNIVGCNGKGGAAKLAEITVALALAGEISITGAICSGEFAQAHADLGRPQPPGDREAPATETTHNDST
jgi:hydroxymethylglutaryl-CoA reductase (NADPH)